MSRRWVYKRCAYFIGCLIILEEIKWKINDILAKIGVAQIEENMWETAYNSLVIYNINLWMH